MTQAFKTDSRLPCPFCIKFGVTCVRSLRVPVVHNATEPVSGQYWCTECDRAGTETRIAWRHSHVKGEELLRLTRTARRELDEVEHMGRVSDAQWVRDNDPDWLYD